MKGEKQKVCVICEEKKKSKSKKIIQEKKKVFYDYKTLLEETQTKKGEKKKVCVICPAATQLVDPHAWERCEREKKY